MTLLRLSYNSTLLSILLHELQLAMVTVRKIRIVDFVECFIISVFVAFYLIFALFFCYDFNILKEEKES